MKSFFNRVRRHIANLDAEQLREQYVALADEVEFFDRIFRTIDRGILALDPAGAVVFSNPCAKDLLGMEPAEAVKIFEIPLGKSSRRDFEITYPAAHTVEMVTSAMSNGDTLVLLRDVTADRNRSEEELRAGATEAVRELASGVAHEIGNPLNAISLNLQLLERQYPNDPSIAECHSQIARLDGILKGFLQALRPSHPNLMAGSIVEPLTSCINTLGTQFEERRITVNLDAPGALPSVAIDKAQFEQVFFNLLKNAIEAMGEGGTIAITVGSDDNDVIVVLRDSGQGIGPDQIAHLFEPYRTYKEHGNGLGLMISARIVRDHGGTIGVESEPGSGTAFTISLPRIEKRIRALK